MDKKVGNAQVKINKLLQDSNWLSEDLVQTKKEIEASRKKAEEGDQKIIDELRQKTSENVWEQKFSNF